ncbi:MAG: Maf family protein [Pseudomonadota bacterium]
MSQASDPRPELILASGSKTRLDMLRAAGLSVAAEKPGVDEDMVKQSLRADGAGVGDVAEALAEMKALRVSQRYPGAHVVAADQMLECGEVWFDKPPDRDHLLAQLLALRGKTHELISSVVVAIDGGRIWHHTDRARLTMRDFSDQFAADYVDAVGDAGLASVGGYQVEGRGIQLFSAVSGSHHTILGMPLLPLLDFLRQREVVAA